MGQGKNVLGLKKIFKHCLLAQKRRSYGETYDVDENKINAKVPILIEETDSSNLAH